jgi:hypothetical protein
LGPPPINTSERMIKRIVLLTVMTVLVGLLPLATEQAAALTNTSIPQISGELGVGGKLTATPGSWSAPATYQFQWLECAALGCAPIAGLTAQTVTVPASAAYMRMRVVVRATSVTGSATSRSRLTSLIAPPPGTILLEEAFNRPDGLITNEFSYWNRTSPAATVSSVWRMTSGSLFAQNGTGWTGIPDGCPTSSVLSTPCTASDVFRLNTAERDFGNVTVSMDLLNNYLTSSSRTPPQEWDGVHIWLHYRSEYSLYYASFNRRDGHIVIKKKCRGGTVNGGTYYELGQGEVSGYPIPFGVWQHVAAAIHDNTNGSVTVTMYRNGVRLLAATDTGQGCAPITASGSVGVRGDNDNFNFDNFVVTQGGA